MSRLVDHQARFMETVMGGPDGFTDEQIHSAHWRLDITDEDFDELIWFLEQSLLRHDVDRQDTTHVVAAYRALQDQVVNHPGREPATDPVARDHRP